MTDEIAPCCIECGGPVTADQDHASDGPVDHDLHDAHWVAHLDCLDSGGEVDPELAALLGLEVQQ